ncbi:MAG: radical SAM protein, partial [Candidatus Omnitrophica bacterium]|nr:radical SAM protein [Candidatus Omnitrophota bacterium]
MSGHKVRHMSAPRMLELVKYIINTFGIRNFYSVDDNLGIDRGVIKQFARLVIEEGLDIKWRGMTRVDLWDRESLELVHRAGLVHLTFGVETADQQVSDAINKQITIQQVRDVIRWCKEIGIGVRIFLMTGLPFQTYRSRRALYAMVKRGQIIAAIKTLGLVLLGRWESSIDKTIRLLEEMRPDEIDADIYMPYPGSEFSDNLGEWGIRIVDDDYLPHLMHRVDWLGLKKSFNSVTETDWMTREDISEATEKILAVFERIKQERELSQGNPAQPAEFEGGKLNYEDAIKLAGEAWRELRANNVERTQEIIRIFADHGFTNIKLVQADTEFDSKVDKISERILQLLEDFGFQGPIADNIATAVAGELTRDGVDYSKVAFILLGEVVKPNESGGLDRAIVEFYFSIGQDEPSPKIKQDNLGLGLCLLEAISDYFEKRQDGNDFFVMMFKWQPGSALAKKSDIEAQAATCSVPTHRALEAQGRATPNEDVEAEKRKDWLAERGIGDSQKPDEENPASTNSAAQARQTISSFMRLFIGALREERLTRWGESICKNARMITYTGDFKVELDSLEILATAGCYICAPIICQTDTPEGKFNHLVHFVAEVQKDRDLATKVNADNLDEHFGYVGNQNCLFILPFEETAVRRFEDLSHHILRKYPNSRVLLISIKRDKVKNAIVLREGIGINIGDREDDELPGSLFPQEASAQTLALTWQDINSLLGKERTRMVEFEELCPEAEEKELSKPRDPPSGGFGNAALLLAPMGITAFIKALRVPATYTLVGVAVGLGLMALLLIVAKRRSAKSVEVEKRQKESAGLPTKAPSQIKNFNLKSFIFSPEVIISASILIIIDGVGRLLCSRLIYSDLETVFKPILGPLALGHGPHPGLLKDVALRFCFAAGFWFATNLFSTEEKIVPKFKQVFIRALASSAEARIALGLLIGSAISMYTFLFLLLNSINWISVGNIQFNLGDIVTLIAVVILVKKMNSVDADADTILESPQNNIKPMEDKKANLEGSNLSNLSAIAMPLGFGSSAASHPVVWALEAVVAGIIIYRLIKSLRVARAPTISHGEIRDSRFVIRKIASIIFFLIALAIPAKIPANYDPQIPVNDTLVTAEGFEAYLAKRKLEEAVPAPQIRHFRPIVSDATSSRDYQVIVPKIKSLIIKLFGIFFVVLAYQLAQIISRLRSEISARLVRTSADKRAPLKNGEFKVRNLVEPLPWLVGGKNLLSHFSTGRGWFRRPRQLRRGVGIPTPDTSVGTSGWGLNKFWGWGLILPAAAGLLAHKFLSGNFSDTTSAWAGMCAFAGFMSCGNLFDRKSPPLSLREIKDRLGINDDLEQTKIYGVEIGKWAEAHELFYDSPKSYNLREEEDARLAASNIYQLKSVKEIRGALLRFAREIGLEKDLQGRLKGRHSKKSLYPLIVWMVKNQFITQVRQKRERKLFGLQDVKGLLLKDACIIAVDEQGNILWDLMDWARTKNRAPPAAYYLAKKSSISQLIVDTSKDPSLSQGELFSGSGSSALNPFKTMLLSLLAAPVVGIISPLRFNKGKTGTVPAEVRTPSGTVPEVASSKTPAGFTNGLGCIALTGVPIMLFNRPLLVWAYIFIPLAIALVSLSIRPLAKRWEEKRSARQEQEEKKARKFAITGNMIEAIDTTCVPQLNIEEVKAFLEAHKVKIAGINKVPISKLSILVYVMRQTPAGYLAGLRIMFVGGFLRKLLLKNCSARYFYNIPVLNLLISAPIRTCVFDKDTLISPLAYFFAHELAHHIQFNLNDEQIVKFYSLQWKIMPAPNIHLIGMLAALIIGTVGLYISLPLCRACGSHESAYWFVLSGWSIIGLLLFYSMKQLLNDSTFGIRISQHWWFIRKKEITRSVRWYALFSPAELFSEAFASYILFRDKLQEFLEADKHMQQVYEFMRDEVFGGQETGTVGDEVSETPSPTVPESSSSKTPAGFTNGLGCIILANEALHAAKSIILTYWPFIVIAVGIVIWLCIEHMRANNRTKIGEGIFATVYNRGDYVEKVVRRKLGGVLKISRAQRNKIRDRIVRENELLRQCGFPVPETWIIRGGAGRFGQAKARGLLYSQLPAADQFTAVGAYRRLLKQAEEKFSGITFESNRKNATYSQHGSQVVAWFDPTFPIDQDTWAKIQ